MLTLCHKGLAICAQKVRVCLAEKEVKWESRITDVRDPEYLKVNPNGYVPTLIHDGRIVTESRIINEYINAAFDGPELLPDDPYDRARVALWCKQIDDSLHLNVFTLFFVLSLDSVIRRRSPEELEINLPFEVTKRDRAYDLLEKGFDSKFVDIALARFVKLTEDMEAALESSPWLAGDRYTLADIDFTPYVQRLITLGLGFLVDDKPRLQAWFDRVKRRSSFREVLDNWVSEDAIAGWARDAAVASPLFRVRINSMRSGVARVFPADSDSHRHYHTKVCFDDRCLHGVLV
jgi:glutathione S-transferase